MLALCRRFIADENGANVIEYGLAMALGVLASFGLASEISDRIETLYSGVNRALEGALNGRAVKPF